MEFNGVTRIIVIMLVIRVIGSLVKNKNKGGMKSKPMNTTVDMNKRRASTPQRVRKTPTQRPTRAKQSTPDLGINFSLKKPPLSEDTKPNGRLSPIERMARRERELERKNR